MMLKSELRIKYKNLRKQLSPGELNRLSEEICQLAMKTYQLEGKVVSLFLPIEKHHEINTYILLEKASAFGAKIVLPQSNFKNNDLKHIAFQSYNQLEVNQYNIPEPTSGKTVAASKIDIVFVPLLTIDHKGYRVGYGKGFYDRFLTKCNPNCIFVGLHLFENTESIEDLNKSDVPLHACITPTKIIRFE